ncbi:uncharacterized protein LOC143286741 isoform X3 [Babylonia areolata]|uniref:uncharacterized protein LOC143286741 isoform X3 n=1 Tax=Babylonia areolata TaxID=304850 RepID=UPI003FD53B96
MDSESTNKSSELNETHPNHPDTKRNEKGKAKGKSKSTRSSPADASQGGTTQRTNRGVSSAPARSSRIKPPHKERGQAKNRPLAASEDGSSSEVTAELVSVKNGASPSENSPGQVEEGAQLSSSELSDESYILQKFSSYSSSEDSEEDQDGLGGRRTYPLPVGRPHTALLDPTYTSLYDLRNGALFKATDNRLQDELMRTTQLIYSCESGRMVPKLREPRNLYALAKELGPQQAARWPSEIEVQRGRVLHMYHVPSEPEPFYKLTGTEKTPMCRGEENGGKVVFRYDPKFSFYMRSRVGGSRNGCSKCSVDLESDNDTTLLFESRFESGNLAKAVKVGDYDYELWLRYDLYTNKHTQWFYFRVTNMKPNIPYRFTIVNFLKPDSLYNYGMRPCMYSDKEALQNKVGWIRAGQNIKYYRNNLKYETSKGDRSFYSLTWTMQFPYENDTVYLAHCYPYTYSDLQDYLLELQNDPIKSRICKQRVLCRTLAGNLVYVLTITSSSQNPEDMKHKKAVVLTSRVHPGESNASWMMKGFLDYLTGNSADAKLLRDTFIFKIVPMLNPDGVIVGNYRCSLAGRDLNRNYKTVLKDSYPSVWHTKNMIRKLLQERDIIVYCDLHGHSRRQNVFIYGCEQRLNTTKRLHERIFPCMLHKNSPDKFSYEACKFKVQKSKEGTGRIVMWNMGIMNSFTMEATFCGSSMGKKKGFHFTVADYESMGYHFCDTLLDYCDPDNAKYANILGNLENRMKMEILARFGQDTSNAADVHLSDYASDIESSDGGSDSSVSDGPPAHLQYSLERRRAHRPGHSHHHVPHCAARSERAPCACFLDMPLKKKKKLKTRKDRDRVRQPAPSEDAKKPSATSQAEEKAGRAAEGATGKGDKVGTGHTPSGKAAEKVAPLPFRYSSNASKRPRSNDERTNSGIPIFVQERYEEKQQKRQDYLQALTTAYLRNGIPLNKDAGAPVPDGSSPAGGVEEFVRSQITPSSSITPLDRRPPSRPHLLEVSAAQQRQQDTLRDSQSAKDTKDPLQKATSHSSTTAVAATAATTTGVEEDVYSSGVDRGKPHLRTRVPSATAVSYKGPGESVILTQPISLLGQGTVDSPHQSGQGSSSRGHGGTSRRNWERSNDGRKSRKGMHEGEDEEMDAGPTPRGGLLELGQGQGQGPSQRVPRVKSAHTSQDMADAMDSIRQLQSSLHHRPNSSLTSATGTYIKQLIKETNDEIQDLTNEIEDKIEHKLQEVRQLQHQQGAVSARSDFAGAGVKKATASNDYQQQMSARSEISDQPPLSHREPSGALHMDVAAGGEEGEVRGAAGSVRYLPYEDRKRVGSAVHTSSGGREEYVQDATGDGAGEMAPRARSARSSRQVVETVPTKISLMICSDHKDGGDGSGKQQFLPLYRSVRAPFFRNYSQTRRK